MSLRSSILLAALVALAACSGDSGDGVQAPDETPDGDVLVRNDLFQPSSLEVPPGTTVVWAWASAGREHNVTFDDGETSGNRSSGTYTRAFATAGTFPYHCTIHGTATSGMRGSVTVAAGSPGGGGNGGGGNGGGGGYGGGGYGD